MRELRQRVRPFRAESFSLKFSEGVALCGARESAAPAAGAKRKDNMRFSFLFELLPFPCFLIWRRLPICDRCEKEYGRGFFLCCGRTTFGVRPLEQPIRRVRYRSATHVVYSTQARHNSVAQSVSLEFTHGICGLVVWYKLFSQALSVTTRSRIARHCHAAHCGELPACVAVRKQLERLRKRNGRTQRSALRKRNRTLVPL